MPYPIGRSDLDSHDPTTTSRGLKAHRRTRGDPWPAGWERQQGSWRRGRMGYVNTWRYGIGQNLGFSRFKTIVIGLV